MMYVRLSVLARSALIGFAALVMVLTAAGESRAEKLQLESAPISFPNPALAPACLIEFSYLINQSGIDFLPDSANGTEIGGIFAQVVVYDSASLPLDSISQSFNVKKSEDVDGSARIAGRLRLPLDAGRYSASLTVIDIVSKREATNFFQLPISAPPTERLSISGIELAHSITLVDANQAGQDPLVKNGRRVAPNPSGLVSAASDSLRLYVELYNLQANDSGAYRVGFRVELSEPGVEHPHILDEAFFNAPGSSIVYSRALLNKINHTSEAVLRFIVTDANAQITDTSLRRVVFVGDEPLAQAGAGSGAGKVGNPYDDTSHKTRMNIVYWLLSPHQREMLESFTLEGQRQFIERFWFDNDPDPQTVRNEFRDAAFERFTHAVDRYSHSAESADGWKSDPGRVLMQYGLPDEIIEVPAPTISNDITDYDPWERWNYESIQGGIYFIFANEHGYGDYRLRHSNAQGETFDRGVEEQINQVFRSSGG